MDKEPIDLYELHRRNMEAEQEYIERRERDRELYEETIETESGFIITSYNYSKNSLTTEELRERYG